MRSDVSALTAAGGGRAPAALSPSELVEVNRAFGVLRRHVEAAFAPVAAEIARQSRVELGKDSLAKKQGFRSPVALIQATTGSSIGDAMKLVQVGEATAPRVALSGQRLPAKNPHIADAVQSGALSVTTASAIVSMLDRIAPRVGAGRLAAAERELVALAPGLRADELSRLLARAEATRDPEGLEISHETARAERKLEIHERDGRLRITGEMDIETGAPITAAIDAMVTKALRANHEAEDATRDQRTPRQMRADALAARRLASDVEVIPWVMGGDGEILDWGRDKRGFTKAQRLALAERDGGCACCGAPVAWAEVHHIQWWSRGGRTGLSNGILPCTACHHRIHDDGWEIRIGGGGIHAAVWFIPPPWIDPARAPRPGGRRRYTLTA